MRKSFREYFLFLRKTFKGKFSVFSLSFFRAAKLIQLEKKSSRKYFLLLYKFTRSTRILLDKEQFFYVEFTYAQKFVFNFSGLL